MMRPGAESQLSMVSDYTISYGMEALEPQQLVRNAEGRSVRGRHRHALPMVFLIAHQLKSNRLATNNFLLS
jgi:hypothetical protein